MPVLIALMHDLLITAGVYALTGREVTTSTVAALLTILGYSLYDTIIVFDRVRENVPRMPRAAFSQIVNRSMSEVLTRSLATTLLHAAAGRSRCCSSAARRCKDFAFALLVGIASGAYSSIFIASPVLTHWKEREPAYRSRRARDRRASSASVPAYATTAGGRARGRRARAQAPAHAPRQPDRARGAGRADLARRVPGAGRATSRTRRRARRRRAAPRGGGRAPAAQGRRRAAPRRSPTPSRPSATRRPTSTPEDLVLKDEPKPRQKRRAAAQPPPREVALMGMLAWVMMGLAIWHFTIFLPDRFWGGIVGALRRLADRRVLFGLIINGFTIPARACRASRRPTSRSCSTRSRAR